MSSDQLKDGGSHRGGKAFQMTAKADAHEDVGGATGFGRGFAQSPLRVDLPLERSRARELRAGQPCLLSGPLYTLRDAGHVRLLKEMDRGGWALPYGLEGQSIFYAGPTPPSAGRPFGAIGPTTSSRMDFAAVRLYDAGIAATVGKGVRSADVKEACIRNGAVYFVTVGGAAAYLAKCVRASETLAYDDLGTEALRRIEVRDFPVFVGLDVYGNDIYALDRPRRHRTTG